MYQFKYHWRSLSIVCWKNPITHFLLHFHSSLDADQVSDLLSAVLTTVIQQHKQLCSVTNSINVFYMWRVFDFLRPHMFLCFAFLSSFEDLDHNKGNMSVQVKQSKNMNSIFKRTCLILSVQLSIQLRVSYFQNFTVNKFNTKSPHPFQISIYTFHTEYMTCFQQGVSI